MSRYEELLRRAMRHQVQPGELSWVIQELLDPGSSGHPGDAYTLLHILGHAGNPSHRGIVERFLGHRDDPMVARLALEILCSYWNLTDEYLPQLMTFLRGVDWDHAGEVRQMAISVAGEYLRSRHHPEMLNTLLEIFESADEDVTSREDAYFALARAVGRDWEQLPPATRALDLTKGVDPQVIQEARRLLDR